MSPSPQTRDYGPVGFAAMTGSSIAGHDAAPWVTDFLNAAYYRRPAGERAVDDLRVAFCILTTHWWRKHSKRRIHVTDLPAFHHAFGGERFASHGLLDRAQLLAGGDRLLGDWFAGAYADDARRAWGIAFPTVEERDGYEPERRFALARVGELTPESAPPDQQTWHTYPPVAVASAERVIDILVHPEQWPDLATATGRFTPLRPGGLLGQIFEIEVAAGTESGRPVFTRGYVTITALVTPDDPPAQAAWFAALEEGLATYGDHEPRAVPEGATPLVGFDLTTHQGHFMGRGHNRLLLYEQDGQAYARAAGTWDPMRWHVERAYRVAGQRAQHAFWGQGAVEHESLLHQLAERAAA